MLRMALGVIGKQRLCFVGPCYRIEKTHRLVHWVPKHGQRKPGNLALAYIVNMKGTQAWKNKKLRLQCKLETWVAIMIRQYKVSNRFHC